MNQENKEPKVTNFSNDAIEKIFPQIEKWAVVEGHRIIDPDKCKNYLKNESNEHLNEIIDKIKNNTIPSDTGEELALSILQSSLTKGVHNKNCLTESLNR
jgi:hypothetical protein